MDDIKKIYKKFANERFEKLNSSMRGVSKKHGVDVESLYRILKGNKGKDYNPGLEVMDRFMTVLGTSWSQFAKYVNKERRQ